MLHMLPKTKSTLEASSKFLIILPEREPDPAAEDAEESLEGWIPDGAWQTEGQLAARGEGAEEESGM